MYLFENDYSEGACQKVLDYLGEVNMVQSPGYGVDSFSEKAQEMIRKLVHNDSVDVHFITGGTPCNVLAISLLKPYEAVICVSSGHINVHETGAVEATGHKIIATEGKDGKILPEKIEEAVLGHTDEHMVKPKMVFLSNATEYGTIYTKAELKKIREVCDRYGLYLYLDGARLGNALAAQGNDLTFEDVCELSDIFYIGGTKNGALLGEAMVIRNNDLKPDFRYYIKRQCSMLAKTRIISQQFIALLEDETYMNNARNANDKAQQLKKIFTDNNIRMYMDSPTNQIFPIIENSLLEKIKEKYVMISWGRYDDDHTIVRFVCSWATGQQTIDEFAQDLKTYLN